MISVNTMLKRLQIAALTLAAMMAVSSAYAAGTLSGTSVENTATVNYDVAGIVQEEIESSPAGNSTSGAGNGTPTAFVVDNLVDLDVSEIGGATTETTPGFSGALTTFRVTNEGNTTQDYALSVTNLASTDPTVHSNADTDVDMTAFQVFVDVNDNDTYEPGTDTATFIGSLAPDDDIEVFVLSDAPLGALTSDVANIRLTATTNDAGTSASTPTVETGGTNTAGIDVVFGDDDGNDGFEFADDGYTFATADLLISKTSEVVEDPFNGATNPKAIPGAYIEYSITIENGGSEDADNVVITDTLADQVIALLDRYNGAADDIEIQPDGAASIFCTFDTGDGDGCGLTGTGGGGEGGLLTIDLPGGLMIGSAPASNSVTILFQVEIL
jgi:uncharacterized repeat protein (TIGR01451 family)